MNLDSFKRLNSLGLNSESQLIKGIKSALLLKNRIARIYAQTVKNTISGCLVSCNKQGQKRGEVIFLHVALSGPVFGVRWKAWFGEVTF